MTSKSDIVPDPAIGAVCINATIPVIRSKRHGLDNLAGTDYHPKTDVVDDVAFGAHTSVRG